MFAKNILIPTRKFIFRIGSRAIAGHKSSYSLFALVILFTIGWSVTSSIHAESVTLNLKGADINALIGTVAEITGKNFIVDPRVKGKVTIISSRPMDEKKIYAVFLSVLEVHGFTAIRQGNVIKILPDADAKHSAIPAVPESRPGKGDEAVTRVIEVQHVTAAQLVPILRPLVPPQGHLAAYPQSNVLIISDRAANIARIMKIIARIDQPTSGEIEFVQLEHASASDIVKVLNSLQQQGKKKDPKSQAPILVADDRTNSILIGGEKAKRVQLRAIIAHLDTPTETEGDTHVIYLRYAKAKDLVPVLTGIQTAKAKQQSKVGGKARPRGAAARSLPGRTNGIFNIQADESTNALVITAPPNVFKSLQSVIRKLDVRRAQVLVEAIIAEVSLNAAAQLGIDWAAVDTDSGNTPLITSNPGGGLDAVAALSGGLSSIATTGIPNGLFLGLGRIIENGLNFATVLRALKTDNATNILSTPNLVTLDNEEAEIFVGNEISVQSGSFTSNVSGATNPFTTTSRTKVGISLKVKPQISEGDAIKLEIEQKVDDILSSDVNNLNPRTSQRSIKTIVMVDDGKILVLGGLIKENVLESESKVPFLGDIPFLGALFRSKSTTKDKTNLMVFLRPKILRTAQSGLQLTQSKYDYIRGLQQKLRQDGVAFLADEEVPVLPQFDTLLQLPPPFEEMNSPELLQKPVQPQSSLNAPLVDNF